MFHAIDSMGDGNGEVELFEIVLYMQDKAQHLFQIRDSTTGELVIDEGCALLPAMCACSMYMHMHSCRALRGRDMVP